MAAVIKVKRRLDEDPAEALVVQLDDDDDNGSGCDKNTTLPFSNHPDCSSCYKRQRRGLDCDSSANDKAKPTVRFDYLTTFSERESDKTSSVRITRRLKRLLQNPTNSDMRKAVVVKRRLQSNEHAKTYRLNSRVGKDSGISVAQRRKTSFPDSESDSSSSAMGPKSKTKRTKKTYRLKRKFRQLVDADDIELINSNICAMSMSSKPDDKVSKPKNQFPSSAAKRWRANDTVNKDNEDDLLREAATGENLLYDAVAAAAAMAASSKPVPIFLGELEDWDAVDEHATTLLGAETGKDVSKAGQLAKLAESEDSGSVTTTISTSNSTVSTPDRPTQAAEFAADEHANNKAEIVDDAKVKHGEENGAETFNKVVAVANNNTCSSAEYVYDLYVRRLTESDIPAAGVSSETASNYLPPNGVVAGSCDGYCSEEVDGHRRGHRLHAGDQVREADEDENEQNYADERSYSTLANADDMAPRATISDDEEDEHAYADGERRRITAQLIDSTAATSSSSNRRVFSPTAHNELLCGESLLDDDNDRRSNDDDEDDEQTEDDDFYADEHVQRQYENNLVDVISNDDNAAASSSSRRAVMHANFVHNSGLNRFRRDWLALSTRNTAADDLQAERAQGNSRRPPNTRRRRRRGQFSERNRLNMTELANNVENNADGEYFAQRDRRSTLPNVVSGQTLASAQRREANAEENAVAQANSTVQWTRRRFSDAPMDHDADTSNMPSTSSAHMRPTTHPQNFMLRHQMRPIVQITNQRRTSMDNSDAEFYYENDEDNFQYSIAGRSLFPGGGGLRHNNENFICLSRFGGGRSGRRNVMAPTPAPRADVAETTPPSMGVDGTDHGGQRQISSDNNEQRGNLRFFYDNDLDDDDIFAHMSNGEESPHPHSDDTEDDDEGGDDGGLGTSDAGDDVEYGFGSNEDSN